MSTVSVTSNSAGAAYATQLAQTSALQRSLSTLGTAVQNGDLTSANSILTAFIKANPQYASASTSSSGTQTQDPINQAFQTLASAISSNQVDAARNAWTQIKTDLAKNGVKLNGGTSATTELLAQNEASVSEQIISDILGGESANSSSITSLLGGSEDSSPQTGLNSSLLSEWLTYQQSGATSSSATANSTGINLNTAA